MVSVASGNTRRCFHESVGRKPASKFLSPSSKRDLLNFSGSGICLALDTPNTPSAGILFARLDEITVDLGGIANISKDSRLSAQTVRAMYGAHYEEFRSALRDYDPERHFQSELRRHLNV